MGGGVIARHHQQKYEEENVMKAMVFSGEAGSLQKSIDEWLRTNSPREIKGISQSSILVNKKFYGMTGERAEKLDAEMLVPNVTVTIFYE